MNKKFGIVVSRFNGEITEKLLEGVLQRLTEACVLQHDITVVHVPGAIEIPFTAQLLAKSSKNFAAIIALGCVIRGETDHYDYVCEQVSQGCQRVMLDHNVPIIFGILTTENLIQAENRVGGNEGHKGIEAADAALVMADLANQFRNI